MLLALALACTPDPASDDTGEPADTADTVDSGADTGDSDTGGDTGDTDTGTAADADGDGVTADLDCDDTNPAAFPGATETCDGVDENCDGEVDDGLPSVGLLHDLVASGAPTTGGWWYGYDADGQQTLYGRDADEDGVLESYNRREYGPTGLTAEESSSDGVHRSQRYEYDRNEAGWVTLGRLDTDGDGVWNYAYGYEYDGEQLTRMWSDDGYDGTFESDLVQEFDADAHLVHTWSEVLGVVVSETVLTWDGDHLLGFIGDTDGDGVFEAVGTNTWDGDRILDELTTGGAYDAHRTYTYVDADDLYDQSDYDQGNDGSIDYRYGYTWDGDTLVGQTYDQYADGVGVIGYTWVRDADGRVLESINTLDGVVTSAAAYEYTDGVTTRALSDVNGDGTWDVEVRYDAAGHVVYSQVDAAGDGVVDTLDTMTYDGRLRLTATSKDTAADGALDWESEVTDGYVCGAK